MNQQQYSGGGQQQRPQPHLPRSGSEYYLRFFRGGFKRPFLLVIGFLLVEATVGHIGLRTSWQGLSSNGYDAGRMHRCEVTTIFGEKHYFRHYKSLVTFVEPRFRASTWLKQKAISLLP